MLIDLNLDEPAMGAIDHETSRKTFNVFLGMVTKVCKEDTYLSSVSKAKELNFSKAIKTHFGMDTKFEISADNTLNACIVVDIVDINNILIYEYVRGSKVITNTEYIDKYKKEVKDLKGSIDLKNHKVSGMFSRLKNTLTLNYGLFKQLKANPEWITAILMHEIGHQFTFFEAVCHNMITNMGINTAMVEFIDSKVPVTDIEFVTTMNKITDSDIAVDIVKKDDSLEVKLTKYMHKYVINRRYPSGESFFTLSNREFVADQFAVRLCGANVMAQALATITKDNPQYRDSKKASSVLNTLTNILVGLVAISSGVFILVKLPILAIVLASVTSIGWFLVNKNIYNTHSTDYYFGYDDIKTRIERNLLEAITLSKRPDLDDSVRDELIECVKVVKVELDKFNEYTWSIMDKVNLSLFNKNVNKEAHASIERNIERLMNNELYISRLKLDKLIKR